MSHFNKTWWKTFSNTNHHQITNVAKYFFFLLNKSLRKKQVYHRMKNFKWKPINLKQTLGKLLFFHNFFFAVFRPISVRNKHYTTLYAHSLIFPYQDGKSYSLLKKKREKGKSEEKKLNFLSSWIVVKYFYFLIRTPQNLNSIVYVYNRDIYTNYTTHLYMHTKLP